MLCFLQAYRQDETASKTKSGWNKLRKKEFMKKSLVFSFIIMASHLAIAANVVDLQINSLDLEKYAEKAEAYSFTDVSLKVNDQPWVTVEEMETRGQSSIAAKRKNFGIKLEKKISLGQVDSKNVNLLNMWIDKGYVSSKFGLMIVDHLNIGAPIYNEYTEVRINGKTNGLYLMVEKPKSAAGDSPYVVRRAYKSRFKTDEAKIRKDLTKEELSRIEKAGASMYAVIATKSGSNLLNELKDRMDIEAYMKWMIMNSLFKNGDGADEVFFYVDDEMYAAGKIYFRIMPWDFDDLFKSMHNVSINQTELDRNPNTIIYNFEDKLDLKIANDQVLYAELKRLARNLLMTELSQEKTSAILDSIQEDISPYLERSDILELGKLDAGRKGIGYTKNEILEIISNRKIEIEKRRTWLLQRTN